MKRIAMYLTIFVLSFFALWSIFDSFISAFFLVSLGLVAYILFKYTDYGSIENSNRRSIGDDYAAWMAREESYRQGVNHGRNMNQ